MLLIRDFFATFTGKPIADAHKSTEVLLCVSCNSREQVDALVAKALAAGGTAPREAKDYGFMYSHGFEDLDGHIWELIHMTSMPPKE
jgi:predicted lactoylglutathione lyase